MRAFQYTRARSLSEAVTAAAAGATPLAGGTTLVELLRAEIARPAHVVDLRWVGELREWDTAGEPARIGALTSMAALAADPLMAARFPAVVESLQLAASGQLRAMATIGGNLLQASRCPAFRDGRSPCNRRAPGSGCAARTGPAHDHAVRGTSTACVAPYPGDLAVALVAADAEIETRSPAGTRRIPAAALHRAPGATPEREHVLGRGELIAAVLVPGGPTARNAAFVKVRDRGSFAFALGSAAVGLEVSAGLVIAARVVLGSVATIPWRSHEAESVLVGERLTAGTARAAADAALAGTCGPRAEAARGAVTKACLTAASRAGVS